MLQDKDRIFTNLYGFGDVGLKGAMARVHIDRMGPVPVFAPALHMRSRPAVQAPAFAASIMSTKRLNR